MKKKIGITFVFIGIVFIIINMFIFGSKELIEGSDKEDDTANIKIDTSKISDDETEYTFYSNYSNNNFVESYIKDLSISRKNKYIFYYPEGLSQFYLTDYSRFFEDGRMSVRAETISMRSIDQYEKDVIDSYSDYSKIKTYHSESNIKISGYDAEYFKIIAADDYDEDLDISLYTERFTVIIKITSEEYVAITYSVNFNKLSDEYLTELVSKIKVEERGASYLYTNKDNGLLMGTLKQNLPSSFEHGYVLEYSVSDTDYKEIEDNRNTISSTTFTKADDNDTSININMSYEDNDEIIKTEKLYLELKYVNNENYIVGDYITEDIEMKNELYTKISFSYSMKEDAQKRYYSMYVHKIKDDFAYIITIDSKAEELDSIAEDFANYTIQEY